MNNGTQQLEEVFRAALDLPRSTPVGTLRREDVPGWDSLAHVNLMLALESVFGVTVGASEALNLTSFRAVLEWLRSQGHTFEE